MPDFSHLRALEQKGEAEFPYRFEQIAGAPTIWFRPATDANPAFHNETLRRANERAAGRNRRGARVTKEVVAASRDEDKEMFAQHCARRWDVKDAAGEPVEFSPQNCLEYFQALPDWLFDDLRAWLTNPPNFLNGNGAGTDYLGEASPLA